ncbi:MAG: hypothetical protein HY316_05475 [Acidobacteria bacterium]|nr:hypothetical protein [Acidobacteriota bacterium]
MGVKLVYGPHNPHPLSTMKTELVWEGKYDEYGNRREVDVSGCAMPMQKTCLRRQVETTGGPRRQAVAGGTLAYLMRWACSRPVNHSPEVLVGKMGVEPWQYADGRTVRAARLTRACA